MEEKFPIDSIAILIWVFITAVALLTAHRGNKHRMAVNAEGELIELDEHEDVFSEERMQ